MIEVGSQLCLQDIAERVSPIVFQCDRIAGRSAPMLLVHTRDDVVRAVSERVIGEGACFSRCGCPYRRSCKSVPIPIYLC